MSAWSHLPNAAHIDRVVQSIKSHQEVWSEARDATRGAARQAAWDAALALIAYDAADKYLDMSSDQLQVWAVLSEDPAAVLVLPAVTAYERISELELV